MIQIFDDPDNWIEKIWLDYEQRNDPRVHVSDLLYLARGWHRHKFLQTGDPTLLWMPPQDVMMRVLLGESGHRTFRVVDDQVFYDVTVERDGIIGSIDEVDQGFDSFGPTPVEWKFTWLSRNKPFSEMGTYHDQLAAYCAMMGQTQGRLRVVHLVAYGKFSDENRPPFYRTCRVAYEQELLDEWWQELLRRKDTLLASLDLDECPFEDTFEWAGWVTRKTGIAHE